jgi:cell shape-determining protein MreC
MKNHRNIYLLVFFVILTSTSVFLITRSDRSVKSENFSNKVLANAPTDSLQRVIDDLQIQIETNNNLYDERETKYEQIIFEYEIGISHIEKYHNDAYRDFHRILAHKERFNREDEKENIKRLEKNNIN